MNNTSSDNSLINELSEFQQIMNQLSSLSSDNGKMTPMLILTAITLAFVLFKPLCKYYIKKKYANKSNQTLSPTTSET